METLKLKNMDALLKFGKGNAKLDKKIATFSLPAGFSCPSADICLSKAIKNEETGKVSIVDGPDIKFRCFAASQELVYPNVRLARHHNFDLLKGLRNESDMVLLISASLPTWAKIVRVHVSGDYFNQKYFNAWMKVAQSKPEVTFYSYTKSINFWMKNREAVPANFKLTASIGGKHDHLIAKYDLKFAEVLSPEEAAVKGLEVDHTDEMAYSGDKSFALLPHGMQPKGSYGSEVIKDMKAKDIDFAYNKENKKKYKKVGV
jgi:hypothetical protein